MPTYLTQGYDRQAFVREQSSRLELLLGLGFRLSDFALLCH